MHTIKLNNYCSNENASMADAYYVADVFDFLLRGDEDTLKFFQQKKFKRLFISGDHGPHFSSIQTIYNESTFMKRYGIEVHLFFLCSYHAYNRCDSAGVESVRIARRRTRERQGLIDAGDYADAINKSNYHNSVGFAYDDINRSSASVFPVELIGNDNLDLRTKCEFKFSFTDENGKTKHENGVVLCRNVPALIGEEGELYDVFDLRASPPGNS